MNPARFVSVSTKNVIISTSKSGHDNSKMEPKAPSKRHDHYKKVVMEPKAPLVIATGPSGTGKTMMPCLVGLQQLVDKKYERIIITRPTVTVGEPIGYLPGDLDEKMAPFVSHMVEYIDQYNLKYIQSHVEVVSLSHMRGMTLSNVFIIADEMQNSTPMQMKTLMTRVGENSKLVITGDLSQSDLIDPKNGLQDLLERMETQSCSEYVNHIRFSNEDIMRSAFVRFILGLY